MIDVLCYHTLSNSAFNIRHSFFLLFLFSLLCSIAQKEALHNDRFVWSTSFVYISSRYSSVAAAGVSSEASSIFINSSPVMVSCSYRYFASSWSLLILSWRIWKAFSCCLFTSSTTFLSRSVCVSKEQARLESPPRYWLLTLSIATISKSSLIP